MLSQNIQSTNWQSMRFKPPPPNSPIGWRVEFRPLEVSSQGEQNLSFFFELCPLWLRASDLDIVMMSLKVSGSLGNRIYCRPLMLHFMMPQQCCMSLIVSGSLSNNRLRPLTPQLSSLFYYKQCMLYVTDSIRFS